MFEEFVKRLQDYPRFDTAENFEGLPEWKYSGPEDPNLKNLIEEHELEKMAGNGTEIERFLNLMEWVHPLLSQDGEMGIPEVINTPRIIDFVKNKGYSVNCWMKAVVLNEALLSLGFRARRISCKPSKADGNSHSIVMVFSNTKQKWICLDPTFNTYFHDESGGILGFLEIRERYMTGEMPPFRSINVPKKAPLTLHGTPFDSYDEWYAVYMAKNCFRLSCPLKSAFGYESSESPSWVFLSPSAYQPDEMEKSHHLGKGERSRMYFTCNIKYFFQEPELN